MPASNPLPSNQPDVKATSSIRRAVPDAFRVLDWTKLDSAPASIDVARMAGIGGGEGTTRLAVIVNTPRMLRAATVFADQAGMLGAQVRVFIDAKEATDWLYKDQPLAVAEHEWPDSPPKIQWPLGATRHL